MLITKVLQHQSAKTESALIRQFYNLPPLLITLANKSNFKRWRSIKLSEMHQLSLSACASAATPAIQILIHVDMQVKTVWREITAVLRSARIIRSANYKFNHLKKLSTPLRYLYLFKRDGKKSGKSLMNRENQVNSFQCVKVRHVFNLTWS